MAATCILDYETITDPVTNELGPKIGVNNMELDYI